jgi:hypothetical protein
LRDSNGTFRRLAYNSGIMVICPTLLAIAGGFLGSVLFGSWLAFAGIASLGGALLGLELI